MTAGSAMPTCKRPSETVTTVLIGYLSEVFNVVILHGFCSSLPNNTSLAHNSAAPTFDVFDPQLAIALQFLSGHTCTHKHFATNSVSF